MTRRSSIFNRLDAVLGEEWRTEEEVLAAEKPRENGGVTD
jgi:hypothetical protein